jgi:glycosyltransferase involved in cell wall biosynthesis
VSNLQARCVNISVVIPAFNEEKLLPATLESIQSARTAFDRRGWTTEIVVCDNNSTDRTAALAHAGGARVVFEPVNQIGRARNTGAAAATGDWLIFVDADSRPCAGLFGAVAETIAGGDCLAGGSTVRFEHRRLLGEVFLRLWNFISRARQWAAGSFIFCEARAFRELGGFSRELYASEELDLFIRLKQRAKEQGRRIVIVDSHPLITSPRKLDLYTPWEHIRFGAKTVLLWGRPLRSREQCPTWYDGRR